LPAGLYFISIEGLNGSLHQMKWVKEWAWSDYFQIASIPPGFSAKTLEGNWDGKPDSKQEINILGRTKTSIFGWLFLFLRGIVTFSIQKADKKGMIFFPSWIYLIGNNHPVTQVSLQNDSKAYWQSRKAPSFRSRMGGRCVV
jgi:hypothetical protein